MYQALVKAIAQAAKMSVVSDSYSVVLSDKQQFADGELKSVLDNVADVYRCNWEKHGSIVEFRRRDWFRRRASQVPDEWLKPWRDEVEKDGIPTLNTIPSMLSLTDEQVEENIASDHLLGQVLGPSGGTTATTEGSAASTPNSTTTSGASSSPSKASTRAHSLPLRGRTTRRCSPTVGTAPGARTNTVIQVLPV